MTATESGAKLQTGTSRNIAVRSRRNVLNHERESRARQISLHQSLLESLR